MTAGTHSSGCLNRADGVSEAEDREDLFCYGGSCGALKLSLHLWRADVAVAWNNFRAEELCAYEQVR